MSLSVKKQSKRILGSPFKSPQQDQDNQTTTPTKLRSTLSYVHEDDRSPTPIRSSTSEDKVKVKENGTANGETDDSETLKEPVTCPMCDETMISLSQLNQHIDDVHMTESDSTTSNTNSNTVTKLINNEFINNDIKKWFSSKIVDVQEKSPVPNTSKRKSINLDLYDNNKGFGLSDNLQEVQGPSKNQPRQSVSPTKFKNRITRSHWKLPSSNSTCSYKNCGKTLGVRNGVVNCRKCGLLFCNDHTHYKIRLKNEFESTPRDANTTPVRGQSSNSSSPYSLNKPEGLPQYEASKDGVWSRCCPTCYYNKPDLTAGTQINSNDLTALFVKKRQDKVDENQLERNKTIKRFIKLTNTLIERHAQKAQASFWNSFTRNSDQDVLEHDDWESDKAITNCSVCFVKFNFIIRKHHCRLCGKIVCDDPASIRKGCSILVPLSKLVEKMSTLNYSAYVRERLDEVIKDDSVRFRCCVNCKNSLLYDWKLNNLKSGDLGAEILSQYESILMVKSQIEIIYPKYEQLLKTGSSNDPREELGSEDGINKLRNRLMRLLKDFESITIQFKNDYFVLENQKLRVKPDFSAQGKLISNMYQSLILFLQEKLIDFKQLNNEYKELEERRLKQVQELSKSQTLVESDTVSEVAVDVPRLTKKQIRELREQLMVMNEQKFIVEKLIEDYTKLRKFDELDSLIANKNELTGMVEELEKQLGDFGF